MADRVIDSFNGDHRWLSNFWPVEIAFEGILYPSVGHAYVAAKTTDSKLKMTIAQMDTPGKAKRAGRALLVRPDWDYIKLLVMEKLLTLKFADVRLRKLLHSTRGIELIEGNTWGDKFWGVSGGEGENHLGKLLMKIRDNFPLDDDGVLIDG